MIIAGAVLWSLATLATVWVSRLLDLLYPQAFVGIGEAPLHLRSRRAADFYPERDRNRHSLGLYLAIPVGALSLPGRGRSGSLGAGARPSCRALPGLVIALFYGLWASEPERAPSDRG